MNCNDGDRYDSTCDVEQYDPAHLLDGSLWAFYGAVNNTFRIAPVGQPDKVLTLEVVEDPDDGYRSSMRHLHIIPDTEESGPWPDTAFTVVTFQHLDTGPVGTYGDAADLWAAEELLPPHQWLVFGTSNTNDYYPYFTFTYTPRFGEWGPAFR
jgi:hypothetical protein